MADTPKITLTNLQAHRLLYCLIQLRYIRELPNSPNYSISGILRKYTHANWDDYNSRDIREMCAEQVKRTTCIVCDRPRPKTTTGDHLIPKSRGGKEGLPNYIALCRPCNSSKGNKDFIEWWEFKGWKLEQAPVDVLCMYSRLRYQLCQSMNTLSDPAPEFLTESIRTEMLNYHPRDRNAILKSCGF